MRLEKEKTRLSQYKQYKQIHDEDLGIDFGLLLRCEELIVCFLLD